MIDLAISYLHSHQSIIYNYFFSEEISTDCGLVLVGELPINKLVHQRALPNAVSGGRKQWNRWWNDELVKEKVVNKTITATTTHNTFAYPLSPRMITFSRAFLREDDAIWNGRREGLVRMTSQSWANASERFSWTSNNKEELWIE